MRNFFENLILSFSQQTMLYSQFSVLEQRSKHTKSETKKIELDDNIDFFKVYIRKKVYANGNGEEFDDYIESAIVYENINKLNY